MANSSRGLRRGLEGQYLTTGYSRNSDDELHDISL